MRFRRRDILAGIGALVSAPSLRYVRAAVPPFRRKLGAIEITVISDGVLIVPLSFQLPDTPMPEAAALLTAHGLPPDGMPSPTNVTLVKTGNELVLIDAGSGSNFQPTAGKLAENMEAAGLDPASVTKVVFTHCHADHLWGAIDDFDDSERFPKASYVISAPEWDFWTSPNTVTSVPDWLRGMAIGGARILKRLEGKIERRRARTDLRGHGGPHPGPHGRHGRERRGTAPGYRGRFGPPGDLLRPAGLALPERFRQRFGCHNP